MFTREVRHRRRADCGRFAFLGFLEALFHCVKLTGAGSADLLESFLSAESRSFGLTLSFFIIPQRLSVLRFGTKKRLTQGENQCGQSLAESLLPWLALPHFR